MIVYERRSAVQAAGKPGSGLTLERGAAGPGLREWLLGLPDGHQGSAAAFDTRMDGAALFTGQASRGVAKMLRHRGYRVLEPVQSFTVSKHNQLTAAQTERARTWGAALAFSAGPFRRAPASA